MTLAYDLPYGPTPIPGPEGYPLIGNLFDIDLRQSFVSLNHLHKQYGPIYQITILGETLIMVSSQKMVHALCNDDKFHKHIDPTLLSMRGYAGDGLLTALKGEKSWDVAHRILVTAFGPIAVRNMQAKMLDPAGQMLMWWESHAGEPVDVIDQFSRLTLDTIAFTCFGHRFNSFQREGVPPFIKAMRRLQNEALMRPTRGVLQMFYAPESLQWEEDKALLNKVCDDIIADRRQSPTPDSKDVLDKMLFGKDAKTGDSLSDENIRYQMITFLVAGHETTSSLLSFATYYMLKNPHVLDKMRSEVRQALADVKGAYSELAVGKLRYVDAVLRETLRLHPAAPFFIRTPHSDKGAILPGGYHIKQGEAVAVSLHALHRDPDVFEEPEEFRPERWLDGTVYPSDAYKPFGTGERACIGRIFAMQSAAFALSLIIDRFDLSLADPEYELEIQESLCIKPAGFKVKATPRRKFGLLRELMGRALPSERDQPWKPVSKRGRMYVLFGSNNGTCEALAGELAAEYTRAGFTVSLDPVDSVAADGRLPTDGPVILIMPSYDGQPADNARLFVHALQCLKPGALAGVEYCILGVGHRDWTATLHRIPRLVDTCLEELGAERLMSLSLGDAGDDLFSDFEDFSARLRTRLEVDITDISAWSVPSSANCAPVPDFALGRVKKQSTLVSDKSGGVVQSTAIEVDQPWQVGDYLAVVGKNPPEQVERALRVLGLRGDDHLRSPMAPGPLRAWDVFESYVELNVTIGKRYLATLARYATTSTSRITAMVDDYAGVRLQRLSLIDVLERFPDIRSPLGHVLYALPRMRPRLYSISSAPPKLELTYNVHQHGVASRYLASLKAGDSVLCAVRRSTFRPPAPLTTLIMFAADTGIAPFRAFIAQRAERAWTEKVGGTVLYYGAGDAASVLHDNELRRWVREGVLELRMTLSRVDECPRHKLRDGCRFVQDRMWAERAEIGTWLDAGHAFYICGSADFAGEVRDGFARIVAEKEGCGLDAAEERITKLGERYKEEVFTS